MTASTRGAGVLLPGFAGTTLPDWLERRLRGGLAGVCLFGDNIESLDQLAALTGEVFAANPRAVVAIDEEGGDVTRLHYKAGSPLPGNAWLGRVDDVDRTEEVGATVGAQLRAVGCNLNFAPSADVNSNPDNPVIGVRSFGADPALVARHTAAWIKGHQSTGMAVSPKHFPGHGDTNIDSHLALPVVDLSLDELLRRELVPFRAAIAAGAQTVMTSHILLPQLDATRPATFSARVLEGVLRDELGFDGVIVSDALDMVGASGETGIPEAAVRALAGGCDLLCLGTANTDAQLADIERAIGLAVDAGQLGETRLDQAVGRVAALGGRLADERDSGLKTPSHSEFTLVEGQAAFDVSPAARACLEAVGGLDGWAVVQLQTTPNIAAGVAPWGPVAALAGASLALPSRRPAAVVEVDEAAASALPGRFSEVPVVVVGRSIHQHGWAMRLVDALRRSQPHLLVVEMGWPDATRRYADVVTYGGSPFLGASLLALLSYDREVAP